jgi:periplasmic protein TonB
MLIALGAQGLVLWLLANGLGIVIAPPIDAPPLAVALLPAAQRLPDPPASRPDVRLHMRDPGRLPSVPVEITLPAPWESPPQPATLRRTTANDAAGTTAGTETDIAIVSRVEPDYPEAAVAQRAQGTTALAILVEADGRPGAVRVLRSSGDARLDEAAVRAVQKWEFSAATSNAKVVARWGQLEVNFDLAQYVQQHPDLRHGRHGDRDAVATLAALIRSWQDRPLGRSRGSRDLELLTPTLLKLLQKSGPVRNIRFLGVAARPSAGALQSDSQAMRTLDTGALAGWDIFEVAQLRATSQWYCAVDAAGQIQRILAEVQ